MDPRRNTSRCKLFPRLGVVLTALLLLSLALILAGTRATSLANEAGQAAQRVTARAQGSTAEDVSLAGAEGWAQASVEINSAPDDAAVSAVRVKYHVVFAQASELEVQLLTSGAEASYTLWNRQSAEGAVLTQSTEEITAFQGAPVNGTWSLAVRGGDPEGYIDDFSIVVYYETEMPVLQVEGEGPPGTPGFLRLPEGAAPASLAPDEDEKPPVEGAPVVPLDVPPEATIIETQDFEGAFPNPPWVVGGDPHWDDAHCDPCGGDWAAWPAAGGSRRVDPCAGNNYPNNMNTWMIYGPFSLSEASNAGTEFMMWHDTEVSFDWVFFGVSADGNTFTGIFWDGYAPCTLYNIGYPDWVGDPSVQVAWVFSSDASVRDRGVWIDDIVIWKEYCVTVKIAPPEQAVARSQRFSFDVAIEDAVNLGAFEFDLTYNRTCIHPISPCANAVTLGPFLGSTGRRVGAVGPTCGTGIVSYGGYSSPPPNNGPNGDGVLATLTFEAGATECDSALHLQNVTVTDTDGNLLPVCTEEGIVHVGGCPCNDCPEDVNCDGVINILDIMQVVREWGNVCPTRP